MKNPLKERCLNCESAKELGKEPAWCVACADPYTKENRGWVWRWNWLHYFLVSRHNFKILAEKEIDNTVAEAASLAKKCCNILKEKTGALNQEPVSKTEEPAICGTSETTIDLSGFICDTTLDVPKGSLSTEAEEPVVFDESATAVAVERSVEEKPIEEPVVEKLIEEAVKEPVKEQPTASDEISEGRSVPGVSSTNTGSECEHGAMRDAVNTVHPAIGDSRINGQWSQGDKRASAADNALSAKHAAENPPSSFPEIEVNVEPKKELKPKESDAWFDKPIPPAPEPPLRPRRTWEKWYKAQGNSGTDTHAEWKRRAKEAGIKLGES